MLCLYAMSWPNIGAQNPSVLTYRAYPNVLQSSCTTILADFVNKELNVLLKIEIIFIIGYFTSSVVGLVRRRFSPDVIIDESANEVRSVLSFTVAPQDHGASYSCRYTYSRHN